MSSRTKLPIWIWLAAGLIVTIQVAAVLLLVSGKLQGAARNVAPECFLAGVIALLLLGGHVLVYHPNRLGSSSPRLGLVFLLLVCAALIGIYVVRVWPLLRLPFDLASWSEPMFIIDVIKLRTGVPLYLPAKLSNSNAYTFGAPVLTYSIAWLLQHPASVPAFRFIMQFYLVVAAVFGADATRCLLRVTAPERAARLSRLWLLFFFSALFLVATNSKTAMHNVYLHNEALGWTMAAIGFWIMVRHAASHGRLWLFAMAVWPTVAFLVKQNLAIFLPMYAVYLWFDQETSRRTVAVVSAGAAAVMAATVAVCVGIWGHAFVYWVFQVMGEMVVSLQGMVGRFVDVGWYIALGTVSAWFLVRDEEWRPVLGMWLAWVIMVIATIYTMGVAPYTTYFGPATLIASCFFLASVAKFWPDESRLSPAQSWMRMVVGCATVLAVFAGFGHPRQPEWHISPDVYRYARDIEREFDGMPAERVLSDEGDWVYLERNVVAKDRQPILVNPRTVQEYGMYDRIREHYYSRILVHILPDHTYLYDLAGDRGIRRELLQHYREVRRIPAVRDANRSFYGALMMGDIVVLEPIPSDHPVSAATDNTQHAGTSDYGPLAAQR